MTKRAAIYVRVSKAYKKAGETRVTIEEQLADVMQSTEKGE